MFLLCLLLLGGLAILAARPGAARAQLHTTPTPTPLPLAILAPLPGQAVQGGLPLLVQMGALDYVSAELAFAYPNDPTDTWFLIASFSNVEEGVAVAVWDTSTITDGAYNLRLLVTLRSGGQRQVIVAGVRVRNYSPVETNTPAPTATLQPGQPTITPTPTITPPLPTPTPLPTNPAIPGAAQAVRSAAAGAGIVLGLLALLGAYVAVRSALRRRKHRTI